MLPSGTPGPGPGRAAAAPHRPHILHALVAVTRERPLDRKLLVAPDLSYARELLVTLARDTGGWIGWEATTLRHVADELAFTTLHARERRIAGDLEIRALVNRALERAVVAGRVRRLAGLAGGLGFRQALRDSVLELRVAGVGAAELREQAPDGAPAYEVAAVLDTYEALLDDTSLADPAHVFRTALEVFDDEARYVLGAQVVLVPSLVAYGLPGKLLRRLIEHGARLLHADVPIGVTVPDRIVGLCGSDNGERPEDVVTAGSRSSGLAWLGAPELPAPTDDHAVVQVDMFSAATPSEELREVFRRAVAEGVRWDDVEIVATDTDTYGIALDVLCQQLGVGATMLYGVPLVRTRIGRALERWFMWLEDGLPADVLRQALEAGELAVPSDVAPALLARALRALQIGWGRARYEAALRAIDNDTHAVQVPRRDDESEEDLVARVAERRKAGLALAALLRTVLDALPPVPERGSDRPVRTSPAALAAATRAWLGRVAVHGLAEEETAGRVAARLDNLAIESTETSFATALATLRDALADVRAWPALAGERKPWRSTGGMVHLTDVAHAGTTGRRRVFVVGLDADHTGGSRRADPLLPDAVRQRIADGRLTTALQRRDEGTYLLLASLAALRGRVTLSYATSGTLDGRETGPSSVLLQAWRVREGNAALSYDQLRAELSPPACAVPTRQGGALLDARDVWLDAIAAGALLLDGELLVRDCFPSLDAGLRAAALARGETLTPHHGLVARAAGAFDPTSTPGRAISPSALELLAVCPLSWFYRYGLSIYPPQDPEYDPEQWLDAAARGSALHEVFETFAKAYQHRQHDLTVDAARAEALALVDVVAARWRDAVPPPSEMVFESERAELRTAALTFLMMERRAVERGDAGRWYALEYVFGDAARPGRYALDDGTALSMRGRVDRIDELPDGTLRVIDYKTGRSARYGKRRAGAAFDGGRQLQPALYSAALEGLFGRPVARFEYRFPTERGDHAVVAYAADELRRARPIVTRLLAHVREGTFVPTTESKDCAYCDYQEICRARRGNFGAATSPRAEWARANADRLAEYDAMRAHRSGEEVA